MITTLSESSFTFQSYLKLANTSSFGFHFRPVLELPMQGCCGEMVAFDVVDFDFASHHYRIACLQRLINFLIKPLFIHGKHCLGIHLALIMKINLKSLKDKPVFVHAQPADQQKARSKLAQGCQCASVKSTYMV